MFLCKFAAELEEKRRKEDEKDREVQKGKKKSEKERKRREYEAAQAQKKQQQELENKQKQTTKKTNGQIDSDEKKVTKKGVVTCASPFTQLQVKFTPQLELLSSKILTCVFMVKVSLNYELSTVVFKSGMFYIFSI